MEVLLTVSHATDLMSTRMLIHMQITVPEPAVHRLTLSLTVMIVISLLAEARTGGILPAPRHHGAPELHQVPRSQTDMRHVWHQIHLSQTGLIGIACPSQSTSLQLVLGHRSWTGTWIR